MLLFNSEAIYFRLKQHVCTWSILVLRLLGTSSPNQLKESSFFTVINQMLSIRQAVTTLQQVIYNGIENFIQKTGIITKAQW